MGYAACVARSAIKSMKVPIGSLTLKQIPHVLTFRVTFVKD